MPQRSREVRTEAAPRPVGPYSQAVVSGGWIFVSGQVPLDPSTNRLVEGDIAAQTEQVIANLRNVLEAAGSSLADVVRTTVYVSDLTLFPRMNEVYARHFTSDPKPARSTVQAAQLPLGAAIEIDAIASVAG
jgi:2-iminobutanoate/2-iminopropanoate deaminase